MILTYTVLNVKRNYNGLVLTSLVQKMYGFSHKKAPESCQELSKIKYLIYFIASFTATAQATVAPTMGLLPMPRKPIISTCAGTEEEPAN